MLSMSSTLLRNGGGSSNNGGGGAGGPSIADFWKDDFAPLAAAGQAVLRALRDDEAAPDADLYRRISTAGDGSHLYFVPDTPAAMAVKHSRTVPLPALLSHELDAARSSMVMGLLMQASLAWMILDDKVFLWPFNQSASFCSFRVPSGQRILSIGLVPPKKGIFKPSVKWCLVVATLDEVILCALVNGASHGTGPEQFHLVPTNFTLSTDNTRVDSIVGTASGRIFLGGDDGCLYEMTYQGFADDPSSATLSVAERLTQFYDDGVVIPSVLTEELGYSPTTILDKGKRSLMNIISTAADNQTFSGPRKCRKINRTSTPASWLNNVLPDFVLKTGSFLFGGGTSTGGGKIVRMVVDEDRHCLYTLGSDGGICSFNLQGQESVQLSAYMRTPQIVRSYLEAVSRGQLNPPNTGSKGSISFLGGSAVALAGVGGMEGARAAIKAADFGGKSQSNSREVDDSLKPVSIHVVTPAESLRITLVAVTSGGMRLYLSSLSSEALSSGPNVTSEGWGRSMAPSSKLTLCHIRSPPPMNKHLIDFELAENGIKGGTQPYPVDSAGRFSKIDASLYSRSIFLAAVENKGQGNSDLISNEMDMGDLILAICPDSVARLKESRDEKTGNVLTTPGGLAETWSLPLDKSFEAAESSISTNLPGGLIWDVGSVSNDMNALQKLTLFSQTPQDKELEVGLPPPYSSPAKLRGEESNQHAGSNGNRSPRRSSGRESTTLSKPFAVPAFMNMLNFIVSRPKRLVVNNHGNLTNSTVRFDGRQERRYRISKRFGYDGFSKTAMELYTYSEKNRQSRSNTSSNSASGSKPARLRPWLLRPAIVPLNLVSLQHLEQAKEFITLNTGGLHFFELTSILDNLSTALISAGENVTKDITVTQYYDAYGYKEGCAMCLALAAGLGPAKGNDMIRRRAAAASLARASRPKLVLQSDQAASGQNDSSAVTNLSSMPSDPFVPTNYDFQPSDLCHGLILLVSRLLRPIWHKPAVVVTEGRTVQQFSSSRPWVTPAKVEVLLDANTLEMVRIPLRNFLEVMKNTFPPAVRTVPGIIERSDRMMDLDDEPTSGQEFTRALQHQSHLREISSAQRNVLSPSDAEKFARMIEEKNIHSIYRLLARVVQLLNLISLLNRAQSMTDLKEVEWGLLHGLTFCQLVQTEDGQDRIESLLNELVIGSATISGGLVPSKQADQLSSLLAEQCYFFFSPGSRCAYLGLRRATEALSHPIASIERSKCLNSAVDDLESAAKHWHSAPLITGCILQAGEKDESYDKKASRAIQNGSPLAKAVEKLVQLEDVASVVKICLLTALNFKLNTEKRDSAQPIIAGGVASYSFNWEQHLYHKRKPQQSADSSLPSTKRASPNSSTNILTYGAVVSAKDAIDTCYALIFHTLSILLTSNIELAYNMVSACSASADDEFLQEFFTFLLKSGHTATLLKIDCPALERWLRVGQKKDLLLRYYISHERDYEAGELLWEQASEVKSKLSLEERIDCLTRASSAFDKAIKPGGRNTVSKEKIPLRAKEVADTLKIAVIQLRMIHELPKESWNVSQQFELSAEKRERLYTSLIPVSELYNDYAAEFCLFDFCLRILSACRHEEKAEICNLWKNIICASILPCATRSHVIYSSLQNFVADLELGSSIKFLHETDNSDTFTSLFEDCKWKLSLEERITSIGAELYVDGTHYVVPVSFLLLILEELRSIVHNFIEAEWSLLTLAKVGIPYIQLLDAYENYIRDSDRNFVGTVDREKYVESIGSMVKLLASWISSAQTPSQFGNYTNAQQQLSHEVRSGNLTRKIDSLKSKLEIISTQDAFLLRNQLQSIEEHIDASFRYLY